MPEINDYPETRAESGEKESQNKKIVSDTVRIFADNLYKERTSQRMTQLELNKLSGVNPGTISAAEKGQRNLNVRSAECLANALNTEIADLLTLEDSKKQRSGYAAFIRNFIKVREANGISVAQISERTGLTRQTIHDIEKGKNCTLDIAGRLAEAVGVPVHKLFLP